MTRVGAGTAIGVRTLMECPPLLLSAPFSSLREDEDAIAALLLDEGGGFAVGDVISMSMVIGGHNGFCFLAAHTQNSV
jgi:urease accessory protein UreH